MNLFDFAAFIEELRDNSTKKHSVEKYEKLVETFENKQIQDLRFYTEYYSKINVFPYKVPEELEEDFDWDLLGKLIIGSFSSSYSYVKNNNKENLPELYVSSSSGGESITKSISELWSFQILRLFEIYLEEGANLQSLMAEDQEEYSAVEQERLTKLTKWKIMQSKLYTKYGNPEINNLKNKLDEFIEL